MNTTQTITIAVLALLFILVVGALTVVKDYRAFADSQTLAAMELLTAARAELAAAKEDSALQAATPPPEPALPVLPELQLVIVQMKDGKTLRGLVSRETSGYLELVDASQIVEEGETAKKHRIPGSAVVPRAQISWLQKVPADPAT